MKFIKIFLQFLKYLLQCLIQSFANCSQNFPKIFLKYLQNFSKFISNFFQNFYKFLSKFLQIFLEVFTNFSQNVSKFFFSKFLSKCFQIVFFQIFLKIVPNFSQNFLSFLSIIWNTSKISKVLLQFWKFFHNFLFYFRYGRKTRR